MGCVPPTPCASRISSSMDERRHFSAASKMLNLRRALSAFVINTKPHPLLSSAALYQPSYVQHSMSVRRIHHPQLPSMTAVANLSGVRCVLAQQLLSTQVPAMLRVFCFCSTLLMPHGTADCRSTESSGIHLESCVDHC